jgi:hypothetical protein
MRAKLLALWLDERGQDSAETAVVVALFGVGLYVVISYPFGYRRLAIAGLILTPDDPLTGTIKQIVMEALRKEGVDVSDHAIEVELEALEQAVKLVNGARPHLFHSFDAVIARLRPRGHIEEITEGLAKEFRMSTATFRRRELKYSSNATRATSTYLSLTRQLVIAGNDRRWIAGVGALCLD